MMEQNSTRHPRIPKKLLLTNDKNSFVGLIRTSNVANASEFFKRNEVIPDRQNHGYN